MPCRGVGKLVRKIGTYTNYTGTLCCNCNIKSLLISLEGQSKGFGCYELRAVDHFAIHDFILSRQILFCWLPCHLLFFYSLRFHLASLQAKFLRTLQQGWGKYWLERSATRFTFPKTYYI